MMKNYNEQDWSFSHLKRTETSWGPHGYHRYPAKFIPQLVHRLINDYSSPNDIVGDPFIGSGTSGVEALRANRSFWGSDINPVAILISQAKCIPIEPSKLDSVWKPLESEIKKISSPGRRQLCDQEKRKIANIDIAHASKAEKLDYWFPQEFQDVLASILKKIAAIEDQEVRTHFLCAFSNILRTCSIWLSGSTKPQKDLTKYLSDPVDIFCKQVRGMANRNKAYWDSFDLPRELRGRCQIEVQDARRLQLENCSLDFIVSSPPYATCYQYIEIHQLTQIWLEKYNLLPEVDIRNSCIGVKRISFRDHEPKQQDQTMHSISAKTAMDLLRNLSESSLNHQTAIRQEVKALTYYFNDMQLAIQECSRVLRSGKYLTLIVGNSQKRGIPIPTSQALIELAQEAGLVLENKIVRNIPARVLVSTRDRITGRFSSRIESDFQAYPEEDILIFQKPY